MFGGRMHCAGHFSGPLSLANRRLLGFGQHLNHLEKFIQQGCKLARVKPYKHQSSHILSQMIKDIEQEAS
jgi:hypothetical protein